MTIGCKALRRSRASCKHGIDWLVMVGCKALHHMMRSTLVSVQLVRLVTVTCEEIDTANAIHVYMDRYWACTFLQCCLYTQSTVSGIEFISHVGDRLEHMCIEAH